MKITHIILLVLFLVISACVEKIDYLKSDIEQTPVVNCLFQEDSIFHVYVGLSKEILTDESTVLPDANVYIIANNQDTFFLEKKNDYLYESTEVAQCNVEYTLVVETQEYGKITAQNSIPAYKPTIDTVIPDFYGVLNENSNEISSNYFITFHDNPQQRNYYEISVFYRSPTYDSTKYTIHENASIYSTSTLLEHENYGSNSGPYLTFSDISFQETNTVNIITFPSLYIGATYENIDYLDELLIFNIKSVSKDYYLYRKSLLLNKDFNEYANWSMERISNMLFVEKNIKLHSNINNGIGIFAGYSLPEQFFIDSIPFAM